MSDIEVDSAVKDDLDSAFENAEFIRREWEGRQTDWLLQWLVTFSGQTSTSIGVTLTVGGSLISGELISHAAYFQSLAEDFSGAFKKFEGVDADQVKSMILAFDQKVSPEVKIPAPQYLHLRNARVFAGSTGAITSSGNLWRGKITSVEGFTLGAIA